MSCLLRKRCIVRSCASSTQSTPEKTFFSVPRAEEVRKRWLTSLELAGQYKSNSSVMVCEDHFDLENDMENYMRWKIQGGKKIMKLDATPTLMKKYNKKKVLNVFKKDNRPNLSVKTFSCDYRDIGVQCSDIAIQCLPTTAEVGTSMSPPRFVKEEEESADGEITLTPTQISEYHPI